MLANIGSPEVMASFCGAVVLIFGICAVGWAGYCISSIARAADALERIADALEDDACADIGDDKAKGGNK